jgi:hypothetical protein
VSVHYGSPVWSKLLSPIYWVGTEWGSRDFNWEGNKSVEDGSIRMPATVGVLLMLRFSRTRVKQEFTRQTFVASGAVVIFVR